MLGIIEGMRKVAERRRSGGMSPFLQGKVGPVKSSEDSGTLFHRPKSPISSNASESSHADSAEETMKPASEPQTQAGRSQNKFVVYRKSKRSKPGQEKPATLFAQCRTFSRRLAEFRQIICAQSPLQLGMTDRRRLTRARPGRTRPLRSNWRIILKYC
jgi:hypothetical protein